MATFSPTYQQYQESSYSFIDPHTFVHSHSQYDTRRSKTPTDSLINHTGLSPGPLTTTPPLSRNPSQPPEPFRDQPPDQMLWDNGSLSNSPTSVRTPDGDSFEVEMLDPEMRNFYNHTGNAMSTQSPHNAITAMDSSMFFASPGIISDQAIQAAFNEVSQSQGYHHHLHVQAHQSQHLPHVSTVQPQRQSFDQSYTTQPSRHDPWNGQGPSRSSMMPQSGNVVFDPVTDPVNYSEFVNSDFVSDIDSWTMNFTDPQYLISPSEPTLPPQDNLYSAPAQNLALRPHGYLSQAHNQTRSPVEMHVTRASPPPDQQNFVNYDASSSLFTDSYITGNQYQPQSPGTSSIGQYPRSPYQAALSPSAASPSSSEGRFSSYQHSDSGMMIDQYTTQQLNHTGQPPSFKMEYSPTQAMPVVTFETAPEPEQYRSSNVGGIFRQSGGRMLGTHFEPKLESSQYHIPSLKVDYSPTRAEPEVTFPSLKVHYSPTGAVPEVTFENSPEPESSRSSNAGRGALKQSGGRMLGTHLEPKVAKAAHDMRKIVACWHCVLQRDKCGPGDICERCLKRSQRPNADCGLGCSRIKLVDLSAYFLPALVTQMHEDSNLTHFVSQYIHQWMNVELTVLMTCGQKNMPRIPVKVYEFVPRGDALLVQMQYKTDPITHQRIAVKKRSPALGMVHINHNEEKKYDKYITDIVDNHLDAFSELCWEEDDNDFQQKLFRLMIRVKPKSDDEAKLLREVYRLIVVTFIMSHTLTISEDSKYPTLSRMHSYGGPNCYVENYCSPRMTNRQLKYFFSRLQRSIQTTVLNKLQQIFKSSRGCDKWLPAFVAVLGMCMALEDQQKTIHLVMQTKSTTEGIDERDAQSQADIACREIDARMHFVQQIFRWKYNRKCNPMRDAELDWDKEVGFGDASSVNFVRQVAQLVKENIDFLQQRQQVSISPANQTKYTSRLVGQFLLSFWLPNA